jgi:hypothetical protein
MPDYLVPMAGETSDIVDVAHVQKPTATSELGATVQARQARPERPVR